MQLKVPVLGKQGPVWIATSFAVRGSNSSSVVNRVEGLALPAAENGSGSISLVAGVGYLPAVQVSTEQQVVSIDSGLQLSVTRFVIVSGNVLSVLILKLTEECLLLSSAEGLYKGRVHQGLKSCCSP